MNSEQGDYVGTRLNKSRDESSRPLILCFMFLSDDASGFSSCFSFDSGFFALYKWTGETMDSPSGIVLGISKTLIGPLMDFLGHDEAIVWL